MLFIYNYRLAKHTRPLVQERERARVAEDKLCEADEELIQKIDEKIREQRAVQARMDPRSRSNPSGDLFARSAHDSLEVFEMDLEVPDGTYC